MVWTPEQQEKALNAQKERVQFLTKFYDNFKKDGKPRKAKVSYYDDKLFKLQSWFVDFERADSELAGQISENQPYITQKTFDTAKDKYLKIRSEFQTKLLELKKSDSSDQEAATSAATAEKLNTTTNLLADSDGETDSEEEEEEETGTGLQPEEAVLRYQWKELKQVFRDAEKVNVGGGLATAQLDILKVIWNEFRASYRGIVITKKANVLDINFNALQSNYVKLCGKLNDIMNIKKDNSRMSNILAQQIKIPEFDGKAANWRVFKDIFDEAVHNEPTASNALKVQVLKTKLKGDAARLVSHIAPTEANYETCYKILENRYENRREMLRVMLDEIMNIPKQKNESSDGLKFVHDTTYECVMAIENLGISTKNWDNILVHVLMSKLNQRTILDYENKLEDIKELQTLKYFLNYIEKRFLSLSSAERKCEVKNEKTKHESFERKNNNIKSESNEQLKCYFCDKSHSIYKCMEFEKLEPKKRNEWAKDSKACFKCLQPHKFGECKSKFSCKICGKNHNVLLHIETKKIENKTTLIAATEKTETKQIESVPSTSVSSLIAAKRKTENLLATAIVNVKAKNGERISLKAVIDPGSQSAVITEEAIQLLKLPTKSIIADIDGIGDKKKVVTKYTELSITPRFNADYVLGAEALVMKKITNYSTFKGDLNSYDYLQNLLYADPTINDSRSIDILLGVAEYSRIVKCGLIKGQEDQPIAQNTELGWIIMGPAEKEDKKKKIVVTSLITNVEIEEKLSKFFEFESIAENTDQNTEKMTDEEAFCEEHYIRNTKRDDDGRFIVKMPYKNDTEPVLGDSKKAALATLFQLEKKFERYPELKQMYTEAMHDAIKKGHMKLVTDPPVNAHYLPHHAVFKDSTTTKLRTVNNASHKTSNGLNLNEQLALGKMDQPSIFAILLRLRKYQIAIIADIEKMYKQILISQEQHKLQMILWRDNSKGKIETYALTTVTFGVGNSPYLAIRTLKELAQQIEKKWPLAAKAILNNFYMDDYSGGADSVAKAKEMYDQLKAAFRSAGFNLRKFVSNSQELLRYIPIDEQETKAEDKFKTLGINYDPKSDAFYYSLKVSTTKISKTKREILSEISSIYDPLGWIAPVTFKAKTLMQNIWLLERKNNKYEWDQELPDGIIHEWQAFKLLLKQINTIKIPRWVRVSNDEMIQLHGFCDASELGYGAVIYIRSIKENCIEIFLLAAKTKTAPLKVLTIPKLELCGAVLLASLMKETMKGLQLKIDDVYFWCDSKIALSWIGGKPQRWKTFVANKVIKINEITKNVKNVKWLYVSTKDNPADHASRGKNAEQLKNLDEWWHGPTFLKETVEFEQNKVDFDTTIEQKTVLTICVNEKEKFRLPNVSSFAKLTRVFAYVHRFIGYCRKSAITSRTPISAVELQFAEKKILRIVQSRDFETEIKTLHAKRAISASSSLNNLSVFLDKDGLLRVGGRLKNANIDFNAKHQILIPKDSEITALLIRDAHENSFHGGPKLTEAILRQKFWLIKSQSTIKKQLSKCVKCKKQSPKVMQQQMANLPSVRVTRTEKPFENCMVDFTGAFYIKTSTLRASKIGKAYAAIFVCMTVKAVHVELVSDMTAAAFIAALRRFIARRGAVKNMFSDNGTNFTLANKLLHEMKESEMEEFTEQIARELAKNNITWHFSPPGSPHFNGLVEAGVKTVKTHIKRTIGESKLTYEELATLLTQIEAAVNSRPLCSISSSPDDVETLTPTHFLIQSSPAAAPEECLLEENTNWLSRWKLVQRMSQYFWKRWSQEYLNQLQMKSKWHKQKDEVKIGDVVLLKDENMPATKWAMGKVVEKHPGADGLTRVVTIKTNEKQQLKRAIAKICPLVHVDSDDSTKISNEKKSSSRGANFTTTMTVLLLASTFLSSAKANDVFDMNVTAFNHHPGIIFEKQTDAYVSNTEWRIVSYFNAISFSGELATIRSGINRLKQTCDKMNKVSICESVIEKMNDHYAHLDERNAIFKLHARNKRAFLDPVGNILGDLFGILDSRFKKEYIEDISKIMNNEEHLRILLQNHTSVTEATLNIVKNNERQLQYHSGRISILAEEIEKMNSTDHAIHRFHAAAMLVFEALTRYELQQTSIGDTLMETKKGHVNPELISPKQLQVQINLIKKYIDDSILVPDDTNGLAQVYKIMNVKVVQLNSFLVFRLSIPLISSQKYRIFKAISVPTKRDNELVEIVPAKPFILASIEMDGYTLLTENEVEQCEDYGEDDKICYGILHIENEKCCEWNLLNSIPDISECKVASSVLKFTLIKTNEINTWVFVAPKQISLTSVCNGKLNQRTIEGEGMLHLNQHCMLKFYGGKIYPQKVLSTKTIEITIPHVNMSYLYEERDESKINLKNITNFITSNYSQLENQLVELKKNQESLPYQVSIHDAHHYSIIYLLICILIFFMIYCRISKANVRTTTQAPKPTPRNRRVSMPTLSNICPPGRMSRNDNEHFV